MWVDSPQIQRLGSHLMSGAYSWSIPFVMCKLNILTDSTLQGCWGTKKIKVQTAYRIVHARHAMSICKVFQQRFPHPPTSTLPSDARMWSMVTLRADTYAV